MISSSLVLLGSYPVKYSSGYFQEFLPVTCTPSSPISHCQAPCPVAASFSKSLPPMLNTQLTPPPLKIQATKLPPPVHNMQATSRPPVHVGGLQPTTLGEVLGFEVQSSSKFVQILNAYGSYWLTIANIGCLPGQVCVDDSLPGGDIGSRTRKQIASILATNEKKITVCFPTVQTQCGGSDCGLFALAFATSLCSSENPSTVSYIQHSLRSHLLSCLQNRAITLFPRRNRNKLYTSSSRQN